jgi:hypothetical protein
MKLLALPLILLTAAPAQALTWREFWEPFDGGYYYNRPYYRGPVRCEVVVEYEQWVPGNRWRLGYLRRWSEIEWRPC